MKRNLFTVRIFYKGGQTHDFETFKFEIKVNGPSKTVEWEAASISNRPVDMGIGEIAAIWQVGVREVEVPDEVPEVVPANDNKQN